MIQVNSPTWSLGQAVLSGKPAQTPQVQRLFRRGSDTVRFGQRPNTTFLIAPNSLVLTVAGMFGPKSSITQLNAWLASQGHTAYPIQVPKIALAGNTLESTDWLMNQVAQIRIDEASNRFVKMLSLISTAAPSKRLPLLREHLKLKDNTQGNATAKALLDMVLSPESNYTKETDFTREIRLLRSRRLNQFDGRLTDHKRLARLTANVQQKLTHDLRDTFHVGPGTASQHDQSLQKTINHVIDQLAPRAVIVGHSLGGFVGAQALLEPSGDIGMVISLGSPLNGTENIPLALRVLDTLVPKHLQEPLRHALGHIFPAISHVKQGSPEVLRIQSPHQPNDTTLISVANPLDGLVRPEDAAYNENHPGRLNITVEPNRSNIVDLMPRSIRSLLKLSRWNPAVPFVHKHVVTKTDLWEGIAQHCGLVQFEKEYWPQEGQMLKQILEGPHAIPRIQKLLAPKNYEPVRIQLLDLLIDKLQDAQKALKPQDYAALQKRYQPLADTLKATAAEGQPIHNGVADKAAVLLKLLQDA